MSTEGDAQKALSNWQLFLCCYYRQPSLATLAAAWPALGCERAHTHVVLPEEIRKAAWEAALTIQGAQVWL